MGGKKKNSKKQQQQQQISTYRVCDDFMMKEMKDCIEGGDVFFIQEYDDILSNMRRSRNEVEEEELGEGDSKVEMEKMKDDDELRDELNAFNEVYHDALRDATSLFDELRLELLKSSLSEEEDQRLYNDDEDPVVGCGIGLSNLPLLDLKAYDAAKYDELNARLEAITNSVSDALSKCYRDHHTEESLVFIKIYDPQNILSLDAISMSDLSISQSAVIPIDEQNNNNNNVTTTSPSSSPQSTDDMIATAFSDEENDDEYGQQQQDIDEETMNQQTMDVTLTTTTATAAIATATDVNTSSTGKSTETSHAPSTATATMKMEMKTKTNIKTMKKKDYIPIKYLGSMILSNSITYQTLYRSICNFITSRMQTFFQVDFSAAHARAWLEPENYR
jgi:hypothetical protein